MLAAHLPPGRATPRLVPLALLAALAAGCAPELGQTGVVLELRSEAAVDCVRVAARAFGGTAVTRELDARGALGEKWRDGTFRALVYSGGPLGDGDVELQVSGHRGPDRSCSEPVVAQGTTTFTFARGTTPTVALLLRALEEDPDADGFAGAADCAPFDPDVFPREGDELGRCDGRDNDCDGSVDEGCPCTAQRPCYPLGDRHPTLGAGECKAGLQGCEAGKYGRCTGAVLPKPDACDGKDTDCDGLLDPATCPCTDGETRACYGAGPASVAGQGRCAEGTQVCAGGQFGACTGDVPPSAEACNGADDDCDGESDEADEVTTPPCPEQRGVCAGARVACVRGSPGASCGAADYTRAAESRGTAWVADEGAGECDGADNDCDGTIDEGCGCVVNTKEACHPAGVSSAAATTGSCRRGTRTCGQGSVWGACEGAVEPAPEACNGVDDDCDGRVDEAFAGMGEACDTGRPGRCRIGDRRCVAGRAVCTSREPARVESCDGADDDCDGQVDEGFDKRHDPAFCGGPFDACVACGAGDACCDGRCADTDTDALHCGACGNACAPGATCCGAGCHDLDTDPLHCGRCGVPCGSGEACRAGLCVRETEVVCTGGVDEDGDGAADCGDADCDGLSCGPGKRCRLEACVAASELDCADVLDDDADGLVDCADPDCGDGVGCGTVNGWARACRAGACLLSRERNFGDGLDDDGDGLTDCRDTADTVAGLACDGHGGVCTGGFCAHETSCADARDDDGDLLIDCRDLADCGGKACDATGGRCIDGLCRHEAISQCADGLDNDRDTLADCADALDCPSGTACGGGTCCAAGGAPACMRETSCTDGIDNDCDGRVDCSDTADCTCPGGTTCCSGACRNLQADPEHCVTCGNECDDGNACTVDSCQGMLGCRTTLVPDRTPAPGCDGGRLCCNGQCSTGREESEQCTDGLDNDCDGVADCADPDCGCEAGEACCGTVCRQLFDDTANCGSCGRSCPAAPAGGCQVAVCRGGSCAVDVAADGTTCGAAGGNVCCGGGCRGAEGGAAECANGRDDDCDGLVDCQDPDCTATLGGRIWCPGTAGGQCVDVRTDRNNCGGCGLACPPGVACVAGSCPRETSVSPATACGDGQDNDADLLVDCADPDCGDGSACGAGFACCGGSCRTETCDNGVDDDCDGLVDCDDASCADETCGSGLVCVGTSCSCTAGSCPGGCCAGATCVPYAAQTNGACGPGGTSCEACPAATPLCSKSVEGCRACLNNGHCPDAGLPTCETAIDGECSARCGSAGAGSCRAPFGCCGGTCRDQLTDPDACGASCRDCTSGACSGGVCTCSTAADCLTGETCQNIGGVNLCTPCSTAANGDACQGPAGSVCCGATCGNPADSCCNGTTFVNGAATPAACGIDRQACTGCGATQGCLNGICGTCTADSHCGTGSYCAEDVCCPTGTVKYVNGSGVASCVAACPGDKPTLCGEVCRASATDPLHCGASCLTCPSGGCSGGRCTCSSDAQCLTGESCQVVGGVNVCVACSATYNGATCKGAAGSVCCGATCGNPSGSCCNGSAFVTGTSTTAACGTNLQACIDCGLELCVSGTCTACTTDAQCGGGKECADGSCCPTGHFSYTDGSGVTTCVAACPAAKPKVCGRTCLALPDFCTTWACSANNECLSNNCAGVSGNSLCCPAGWKRCDGNGCVPSCLNDCVGTFDATRYCAASKQCESRCSTTTCGTAINSCITATERTCVIACTTGNCSGTCSD